MVMATDPIDDNLGFINFTIAAAWDSSHFINLPGREDRWGLTAPQYSPNGEQDSPKVALDPICTDRGAIRTAMETWKYKPLTTGQMSTCSVNRSRATTGLLGPSRLEVIERAIALNVKPLGLIVLAERYDAFIQATYALSGQDAKSAGMPTEIANTLVTATHPLGQAGIIASLIRHLQLHELALVVMTYEYVHKRDNQILSATGEGNTNLMGYIKKRMSESPGPGQLGEAILATLNTKWLPWQNGQILIESHLLAYRYPEAFGDVGNPLRVPGASPEDIFHHPVGGFHADHKFMSPEAARYLEDPARPDFSSEWTEQVSLPPTQPAPGLPLMGPPAALCEAAGPPAGLAERPVGVLVTPPPAVVETSLTPGFGGMGMLPPQRILTPPVRPKEPEPLPQAAGKNTAEFLFLNGLKGSELMQLDDDLFVLHLTKCTDEEQKVISIKQALIASRTAAKASMKEQTNRSRASAAAMTVLSQAEAAAGGVKQDTRSGSIKDAANHILTSTPVPKEPLMALARIAPKWALPKVMAEAQPSLIGSVLGSDACPSCALNSVPISGPVSVKGNTYATAKIRAESKDMAEYYAASNKAQKATFLAANVEVTEQTRLHWIFPQEAGSGPTGPIQAAPYIGCPYAQLDVKGQKNPTAVPCNTCVDLVYASAGLTRIANPGASVTPLDLQMEVDKLLTYGPDLTIAEAMTEEEADSIKKFLYHTKEVCPSREFRASPEQEPYYKPVDLICHVAGSNPMPAIYLSATAITAAVLKEDEQKGKKGRASRGLKADLLPGDKDDSTPGLPLKRPRPQDGDVDPATETGDPNAEKPRNRRGAGQGKSGKKNTGRGEIPDESNQWGPKVAKGPKGGKGPRGKGAKGGAPKGGASKGPPQAKGKGTPATGFTPTGRGKGQYANY